MEAMSWVLPRRVNPRAFRSDQQIQNTQILLLVVGKHGQKTGEVLHENAFPLMRALKKAPKYGFQERI